MDNNQTNNPIIIVFVTGFRPIERQETTGWTQALFFPSFVFLSATKMILFSKSSPQRGVGLKAVGSHRQGNFRSITLKTPPHRFTNCLGIKPLHSTAAAPLVCFASCIITAAAPTGRLKLSRRIPGKSHILSLISLLCYLSSGFVKYDLLPGTAVRN